MIPGVFFLLYYLHFPYIALEYPEEGQSSCVIEIKLHKKTFQDQKLHPFVHNKVLRSKEDNMYMLVLVIVELIAALISICLCIELFIKLAILFY